MRIQNDNNKWIWSFCFKYLEPHKRNCFKLHVVYIDFFSHLKKGISIVMIMVTSTSVQWPATTINKRILPSEAFCPALLTVLITGFFLSFDDSVSLQSVRANRWGKRRFTMFFLNESVCLSKCTSHIERNVHWIRGIDKNTTAMTPPVDRDCRVDCRYWRR